MKFTDKALPVFFYQFPDDVTYYYSSGYKFSITDTGPGHLQQEGGRHNTCKKVKDHLLEAEKLVETHIEKDADLTRQVLWELESVK